MKDNLISIITPVYNVEDKYLKECLKSIINQTYKNIELLLIIDKKDIKNYNICNTFKNKDKRIKIITVENKGVSSNRNIGIKKTKGKYIAFVDSDDYIEKDYIEKLYKNIIETNSEISFCGTYVEYKNKTFKNYYFKKNKTYKGEEKEILYLQIISKSPYGNNLKTRCGSVWGKLYIKDFIIKNNLYFDVELIRMEDSIYNLNAFNKASQISYINELLYHYRKRANSLSNKYDINVIEQFELFFKKLNNFKKNKSNKITDSINARICVSIYSYIRLYIFNKNNNIKLKEKINILLNTINKDIYKNSLKEVNKHYLTLSQKIFIFLIKLFSKLLSTKLYTFNK